MTDEGIKIPADEKSSRLINFIGQRVEMEEGEIKLWVHRLRGRAEKLLTPNLRSKKIITKSNMNVDKINKTLRMWEVYNL